jgi:hypothetical protein
LYETGRNLSRNWTIGELERELEGESFMMKVLKARVAKFSGNFQFFKSKRYGDTLV